MPLTSFVLLTSALNACFPTMGSRLRHCIWDGHCGRFTLTAAYYAVIFTNTSAGEYHTWFVFSAINVVIAGTKCICLFRCIAVRDCEAVTAVRMLLALTTFRVNVGAKKNGDC